MHRFLIALAALVALATPVLAEGDAIPSVNDMTEAARTVSVNFAAFSDAGEALNSASVAKAAAAAELEAPLAALLAKQEQLTALQAVANANRALDFNVQLAALTAEADALTSAVTPLQSVFNATSTAEATALVARNVARRAYNRALGDQARLTLAPLTAMRATISVLQIQAAETQAENDRLREAINGLCARPAHAGTPGCP